MNVDRTLADAGIRPALRRHLESEVASSPGSVIVEELGLCRGLVRADVVVVNGLLHGYEIKSDHDTLRRLSDQVETYSKVMDRVVLVAGERHLAEAKDLIPSWWGIYRVRSEDGLPRIDVVRRGRANPSRDPRALVELLWRDEALRLLEARIQDRGVRSKPRRIIWDRVCDVLDLDEIAEAVRDNLKNRGARSALPSPS